nr:HupE/UreJ family protein [Nitrospirales bacterium]
MRHWLIGLFVFSLNLLDTGSAYAHKPSDSYLRVTVHEHSIEGQWDMALRDLDYAIGLDGNADGEITWGEMRSRHSAIASYALSRLRISNQNSTCWNNVTGHLIDHHSDGAYAVLKFSANCSGIPKTLAINYGLLFDVDPLHRGLLRIEHQGHTQTAIFSPEQPHAQFDLLGTSKWREFLQFVHEGIWHIWIGYDHILFLISLLLPSVLLWKSGQWEGAESFRQVLSEVLSIITAFTLAHSITLSVATMGLVTLPSRWVESVIAGSVVLAALHNLFPVIHIRRWIVGFVFGLIHGFGF